MADLLNVNNLYAGYGKEEVLQDISFSLKQGEILGVVGESGSGKSTLFNSIIGLLADLKLTSGKILFQDQDLGQMSRKEKQKLLGDRIGVVFQNSQTSLLENRTVKSQFEETVLNKQKMSKAVIQERSLSLFNLMNLPESVYTAYPANLSGGQRQRVCIALAMLLEPDLLLCDEPTSALDDITEFEVADELIRLRDESNVGIFLITHNMALAKKVCDKILVLFGGRMMEYRPSKDLLADPIHPYSRRLIQAIPTMFEESPFDSTKEDAQIYQHFLQNCKLVHRTNEKGQIESVSLPNEENVVKELWNPSYLSKT